MVGSSDKRIALDAENVRDIGATYTVCYSNAQVVGDGHKHGRFVGVSSKSRTEMLKVVKESHQRIRAQFLCANI